MNVNASAAAVTNKTNNSNTTKIPCKEQTKNVNKEAQIYTNHQA